MRTDIGAYIWLTCQLIRYAHWYQCLYLVKTFHKSLKLFDPKMKLLHSIYSHHQLNTDYGFLFQVEVYFEGLLKFIISDKNLLAED